MAEMDRDVMGSLLQEVFSEKDGIKRFLEWAMAAGMEQEVARHLAAGRHERSASRRGYRNGRKSRKIETRVGPVELMVPQVRGCKPYQPSMLERWQRSEQALLVACAEMYFQGVSTRRVRKVLEVMCAGEISSATVSRVAMQLDGRLQLFRSRRLDGTEYPYVKIDARYEKVRLDGQVVSVAVLVTTGFNGEGRRELLDWRVDDSESEATWGQVFRELKDRGLHGVRMVVSDAHRGIRKALSRHFQGVGWQRCQVHFKRELVSKVGFRKGQELLDDLRVVLYPETAGECLRRGEEMACKWEARYPKVARMLREGLEDCLSVLSLPAEHRRRMTSTNMLENLMRQLKRRTRVVGVFPNRSSCDRLIGALLIEVHEGWMLEEKVYFDMEHLRRQEAAGVAAGVPLTAA